MAFSRNKSTPSPVLLDGRLEHRKPWSGYRCLSRRGQPGNEREQFPSENRASLVRRNVPSMSETKARVRQNMKAYSFRIITAALLIAGLAGCAGASAANPSASSSADTTAQAAKKNNFATKKTMRAFRSEAELKSYFREIAEKQKRESRRIAG